MAQTFKVKWKRRWFWRSMRCEGVVYLKDQDKMSLHLPNGTQIEVPEWSKCAVIVGRDWLVAVQKAMELQSGHAIPIRK